MEKVNDFAPQHSRIFKEVNAPISFSARQTLTPCALDDYCVNSVKAVHLHREGHRASAGRYRTVPPGNRGTLFSSGGNYPSALACTFVLDRHKYHQVHTRRCTSCHDSFCKRLRRFVPERLRQVRSTQDYRRNIRSPSVHFSLQATWIRNSILHAVRQTTQANIRSLPGNFVYQHPSINVLSTFISDHAGSSVQQSGESNNEERLAAMYSILDKYSMDFQKHVPTVHRPSEDVVLVTGTTGGLGTALLAALVEDPKVQRVYAVNRHGGAPLAERQRQVLIQRGYDADRVMSSDKVILVETDMDGDNFGFSPDLYDEVPCHSFSSWSRHLNPLKRFATRSRILSTMVRYHLWHRRMYSSMAHSQTFSMASKLQCFPQLFRAQHSRFAHSRRSCVIFSAVLPTHSSVHQLYWCSSQ